MQVVFVNGGFINEMGPFEPGSVVTLPDDAAESLIKSGAASPVLPACKKPITLSLNVWFDKKDDAHV